LFPLQVLERISRLFLKCIARSLLQGDFGLLKVLAVTQKDGSPGECRSAIFVVNEEGNMTRLITCQFFLTTTLARKTIPWILPDRSHLETFSVLGVGISDHRYV
jgi:hypothetical protein